MGQDIVYHVTIIWILVLAGANLAYVQAQSWTAWNPCNHIENCHKAKQLTCTIDGRITYGIGCVGVGDPYLKILRIGCDVNVDCAGQWQSTQNESCIGDCYDGTSISYYSCSTNPTCTMRTHSRCYNDSTCTGHFNILTQTSCSQSCGGGTQTLNGTCTNLSEPPNEQSYNCPGTNGVLALQYSIMSTCNSQACPTWNTWSQSSSCSASCGGGHQTFESFCTYMGSASTLCGNGGTRRNKTDPCNDQQCLTYSQWSQWTTCDSCAGVRTRYRNCASTCTEAQESQIENEECLLSPSCSTTLTTTNTNNNCDVLPCSSWACWEITNNCATSNQIILQRTCNSEWRMNLTILSCPNHQHLRREYCLDNQLSFSEISVGFISTLAVLLFVILMGIGFYVFYNRNVTTNFAKKIRTQNQDATQPTLAFKTQTGSSHIVENKAETAYETIMEQSNLIKNSNNMKKQDNVAIGDQLSTNQGYANLSSLNYVTLDDNAKLANTSKVEYLEPNVQSASCPDLKAVPQPGRSDYEFVREPGYVTPASITG